MARPQDDLERASETARLFTLLSSRPAAARSEVLDRLVAVNLVVARDVARRYEGRGVAADDLRQVAYLGLVKAARSFDPERGTDFLAYAVPTIRGEVRRWFRDAGWMVRPPRSVQELQARITRARDDLPHTLDGPAAISELAEHLGEDRATVGRALAVEGCFAPASLDAPLGTDEECALVGVLAGPDPGYDRVETKLVLASLLGRLDEREQVMLRMRFVEGATQAQIGAELGITQAQVSRLMSALLARLREDLQESTGAGCDGMTVVQQ